MQHCTLAFFLSYSVLIYLKLTQFHSLKCLRNRKEHTRAPGSHSQRDSIRLNDFLFLFLVIKVISHFDSYSMPLWGFRSSSTLLNVKQTERESEHICTKSPSFLFSVPCTRRTIFMCMMCIVHCRYFFIRLSSLVTVDSEILHIKNSSNAFKKITIDIF